MLLLRTLVGLARPALLPTVWSNCVAGWWLGGGGHLQFLGLLFTSATLLYLGGVFLHDAFDAEYDRVHQMTRPIPASGITVQKVWRWGLGLLLTGALILLIAGTTQAAIALGLACVIIVGNASHRPLSLGPVVDGVCRALLYVLGASFGERGVTGWAIWCGVALGCYRMGVGFLARWKAAPEQARYWPVLLLAGPIVLALIMDAGRYRQSGLLISAVLGLWVVRCLRQTFWSPEPNVTGTSEGLLAGMVFADWLATCPLNLAGAAGVAGRELSFAFLVLFGLTLVLQRIAGRNG